MLAVWDLLLYQFGGLYKIRIVKHQNYLMHYLKIYFKLI